MREILFRGKRKDNGEWVQGDYTKGFRNPNTAQLEDLIYMFSGKPGEWEFDYALVIPETVGQFTGLTDKNGTKIFEGDIVKHDFGADQIGVQYAVIKYNSYYASFMVEALYDWMFCEKDEYEVIGNIHDNPELLKEVQG